jgi:hypothetical protein
MVSSALAVMPRMGKPRMVKLLAVAPIVAVLASPVLSMPVAAQGASQGAGQRAGQRGESLLAPVEVPAPVPIGSAQPAVPNQEPGGVTAVPLPPPVAEPPAGRSISMSPIPFTLTPRPVSPTPANPANIVPPLAIPPLPAEAAPADFLRAARGALVAGRSGEARSALEMAETRLLSRSVEAGKESDPSDNLAVKQISEAIAALTSNDRMTCLHYIEFASRTLNSPLD